MHDEARLRQLAFLGKRVIAMKKPGRIIKVGSKRFRVVREGIPYSQRKPSEPFTMAMPDYLSDYWLEKLKLQNATWSPSRGWWL